MRLLDLTLPAPADNLALDEALLLAAEGGDAGEVLRLWELPALVVVVGSGGSVEIDVNVAACAADGVPVLRRASGGGTVLLGPRCLCFSLVLSTEANPGLSDIRASNRYVLGRVSRALGGVIPDAGVEGTSDLAAAGRKFSGNAQQRKRRHFLHHGTLLCGFDLSLVGRYLNAPERQPEYRRDRAHDEFVVNLPAAIAEVKRLLVEEWQPAGGYEPVPLDAVARLVGEKYSRDEWTRRR
ncbi:lipoate--protein ligase family protein [Gemmata sp.]|uniref:lipoate--protein ligase family protein n=1 Tax=Gemmata sp. TaxID=1914242 RepID=UPI003F71338A